MDTDDPLLKGIEVPYGAGEQPGEAPATPAPAAPAAPTPAPPAAAVAHPDDPVLKNIQVPYGAGEQPGGAPVVTAPPPTAGQTASKWTDWLLGPQTELHPRSLSQAGSDALGFARVGADQAIFPGTFDNAFSALPSLAPGSGDIDAQRARTKAAETQIGPAASNIARFMGQRLSVNRFAGDAGVPFANTPIAQGLTTGGVGTLMHGGDWKDALVNAAADTGLSALGEAAGTAGSAAAKKLIDKSKQAVSSVATQGLEHLGDLWKRGGDVAGTAEQYAASAKGAAQDAYQRIAEAANQSTDTRWAQRLAAAGIGHLPGIPGGELAAAYIADPAIKVYNQWSKGHGVLNAIDQSYPVVANVMKSAVNPDAWRSALQNLAVSQGPTNAGSTQAAAKFGPMSWVRGLFSGGN